MEIGLTAKMQKQCKVSNLPEANPENLFYSWDINIEKFHGRNVLYIANANNRFGCIVIGMNASTYKNLTENVLMWIRQIMYLHGYSAGAVHEYFMKAGTPVLTKTHGRKSVGAMSQALKDFLNSSWELNDCEDIQTLISVWLNKKLLGRSAGYNDNYYYPSETFLQDMEKEVLRKQVAPAKEQKYKCLKCGEIFGENSIAFGVYYEAFCPYCGHIITEDPGVEVVEDEF